MDWSTAKRPSIQPRLIIHGGAGNINRENLSREAYALYRTTMLTIFHTANAMFHESNASAIDVATYAVQQLELNPLFNSGKGAVFTTAGTHELEASIMVSRGYRKRGVGVMNVKRTKSPITLAKTMLVNGETADGGGAQGIPDGDTCDELAVKWGLDMVQPSYFWSRKRWDEHRRGLGLSHKDDEYEKAKREADEVKSNAHFPNSTTDDFPTDDPTWNGKEYLPQGTVGAVAMDSTGTLCVCTSTGGLTNKLPGRIGDTPTLGAGFWAEEWQQEVDLRMPKMMPLVDYLTGSVRDCVPTLLGYMGKLSIAQAIWKPVASDHTRAVAMSGTGNGDSFLRLSAVRTAAAIARFAGSKVSLQRAVTSIAGPHGALQRSAEDRWLKTGEGEGGIIGIELVNGAGRCVADFNCGGMFRAWDDGGKAEFLVFREEY